MDAILTVLACLSGGIFGLFAGQFLMELRDVHRSKSALIELGSFAAVFLVLTIAICVAPLFLE